MIRLTHRVGGRVRPNNPTRKLRPVHDEARAFSTLDESHLHRPHRALSTQSASTSNHPDHQSRSWQASHNIDIQRVTQTAMIHELTQQQTRSIEKVVPWFLNTMPAQYFRQVPESFRLDHIKAISAIKDANMDMHMNLKTHLPDGRQVRFIGCGWKRWTVLSSSVSFSGACSPIPFGIPSFATEKMITFDRIRSSLSSDLEPCQVYS